MTKSEQRKIDNEMRLLAERARHEIINLCSTISLPYELQALKALREQIDKQIEVTEKYLNYAKNNSI